MSIHTIRDLIHFAVKQFDKAQIYFGHGTDNAWDEAVFLILHVLNLPQDSDESVLDTKITQSEKRRILELIEKRIKQRIHILQKQKCVIFHKNITMNHVML